MASRRERALFIGALAVMASAVVMAGWILFGRGPVAVEAAPQVARAAIPLRVGRATGTAWLTRGGSAHVPMEAGATLQEADVVEVAEGAVVELGAGESYQVILDGPAKFGVREIAVELARFRLEEGLADAKVRPESGHQVVIESSDDASVSTSGGRVTVASSGGRVAVGVAEGEARLGSGGQIVAVRAGEFSVAERGQRPSAPGPLPTSLLLKVEWPASGITNRRRIVVKGKTTPGALVSLGGERVRVGPDGVFTHILFLREGQQTIEATARDVAGRREHAKSAPVVLDTRAPDAEFDTRNLWGKRRQ